jgi:hypothetical protein
MSTKNHSTEEELLASLKEAAQSKWEDESAYPGLTQVLLSDPEEFPVFPYQLPDEDDEIKGHKCWALRVNLFGFGGWFRSIYERGQELGYTEEELEELRESIFDFRLNPKGPEPYIGILFFPMTRVREDSTPKVIDINAERARRRA